MLYTFCSPYDAWAMDIHVGKDYTIKKIKSAILQASDGDNIIIHAGIYKESNIVIEKNITLIGKDYPTIDGESKGELLTINATDFLIEGIRFINVGESSMKDNAAIRLRSCQRFRIRNNRFENLYYGIFLEKSAYGEISSNRLEGNAKQEYNSGNGIHLWYCKHVTIEDNTITKMRDGIYFEFVSHSDILRNKSYDNLRYGLHFMFSDDDTYRSNEFRHNGAGVAVMYSKRIRMTDNHFDKNIGQASYGLLLKTISDATIDSNVFSHNTSGIHIEGCKALDISFNNFVENAWAIWLNSDCYDLTISQNNFINNSFDLSYSGKENNIVFDRNYWNSYAGYDLNRDNLGDVPYRPVKLFSYIVGIVPESIVLIRSLFMEVINFSEMVAPVFTPENIMDYHPQMKPVRWM